VPSPIGHSLSGVLLYSLLEKPSHPFRPWQKLLPYLLIANLPDIDFMVYRAGRVRFVEDYHHAYSHSLGFGLVAALITYGVLWAFREKERFRYVLLAVGLTAVHCFLDLTNWTGQLFSPGGLPLLWPFGQQTFACPILILPGVATGKSPFDPVNLIGISSEFLLFGSSIALVWAYRAKRHDAGTMPNTV